MATLVLVKLAAYTGDDRYAAAAEAALRAMAETAATMPLGFAQWLVALDLFLAPPVAVAIVGETKVMDDRCGPRRRTTARSDARHRYSPRSAPPSDPRAHGGGAGHRADARATADRAQPVDGRPQLRLPSLRLRRAGDARRA